MSTPHVYSAAARAGVSDAERLEAIRYYIASYHQALATHGHSSSVGWYALEQIGKIVGLEFRGYPAPQMLMRTEAAARRVFTTAADGAPSGATWDMADAEAVAMMEHAEVIEDKGVWTASHAGAQVCRKSTVSHGDALSLLREALRLAILGGRNFTGGAR